MKKIILIFIFFAFVSAAIIDFYDEIEITKKKLKDTYFNLLLWQYTADGDIVFKQKGCG